MRLLLPLLMLQSRDDVFVSGLAARPSRRIVGRTLAIRELRNRAHHGADRGALGRLTTTASPATTAVHQAAARLPGRLAASSARSGSRKVWVRPTGVNLTLTNGRARPRSRPLC